jgi:hypothetical protein
MAMCWRGKANAAALAWGRGCRIWTRQPRRPTLSASQVLSFTMLWSRALRGQRRWRGAVVLALGLALLIGRAAELGAASGRTHCVVHSGSPTHSAASFPHGSAHAAASGASHQQGATERQTSHGRWEEAAPDGCTHCPTQDCASLAPCAATMTALGSPQILPVRASPTWHVVAAPFRPAILSRAHEPPTPPPQLNL